MKIPFGHLPDGREAFLYTITAGSLTAKISDLGATLVQLWVPDPSGNLADVVLGYDCAEDYIRDVGGFFGATVGRNANRMKNAAFVLGSRTYALTPNDNGCNNLHSGPDFYKSRLWKVESHTEQSIRLSLRSPDGDQGFPGKAEIHVTYRLTGDGALHIAYDAVSDKDTVFNFTNHSFFNLAGHEHGEKAMEQVLSMPARVFTVSDEKYIPTGEVREVAGTPLDFRVPKPLARDIDADYAPLKLQHGYDHNFEVFSNPCAILSDPGSGRTMAVSTDCCGIQLYSGNFLSGEVGKGGARYPFRSGVCLETQFWPDAVNRPQWRQPITAAGVPYHSETCYRFG